MDINKYKKAYQLYKNRYIALKNLQKGGNSSQIDELYADIEQSWNADNETLKLYNSDVLTYGELTGKGLNQMLQGVDTKGRIFYDLGSGFGRVVLSGLLNHNFAQVVGVEIVPHRHNVAKQASDKINKLQTKEKLTLINGDLFKQDISKADIIWTSNLCFEDEMVNKLAKKLGEEAKIGATIFVSQGVNHQNLKYVENRKVEMTWTDKSNVYMYKKI